MIILIENYNIEIKQIAGHAMKVMVIKDQAGDEYRVFVPDAGARQLAAALTSSGIISAEGMTLPSFGNNLPDGRKV